MTEKRFRFLLVLILFCFFCLVPAIADTSDRILGSMGNKYHHYFRNHQLVAGILGEWLDGTLCHCELLRRAWEV